LFAAISPLTRFQVLNQYFAGAADRETLRLLGESERQFEVSSRRRSELSARPGNVVLAPQVFIYLVLSQLHTVADKLILITEGHSVADHPTDHQGSWEPPSTASESLLKVLLGAQLGESWAWEPKTIAAIAGSQGVLARRNDARYAHKVSRFFQDRRFSPIFSASK
jgi:hypothetical protein